MLIGDDGGIRRGNSALFSSYCKPFANLAFHNPTWDDPDSKEFKKASELAQRRVFALGDLRGDMDNALAILREAKIIDNEGDWSGGSNTGNVIGNGPNSDDLLRFFARLVKQANEKGGRVIQLLGDQEIMRLINRKNYIDDPSEPRHIVSFSDNTSIEIGEIEKRLYSLPIVQRVGDTVFTHGGLTPFFALKDIKATNDEAKYAISSIMIRNQQDEIIASIFGGDGPVMYQLYANYTKEKQLCSQLKQALKILNAKRMVSGYSIQNNAKIASRCSSQFFGISVGDSKAYRKNKGLLEISPNAMVNAIYTETRETLDAGSNK
ncbi:hypothetical protein BDF19DRAFT_387653 [Syncephalis fuscata]|nr:hypothetical protein BDF19DRAFT_387653 [Syncephalis fuscata]